ncbi:chemotaxis protein MotB [Melghiribacillus thermohalophilus]|uniref:Chemotaxis protein MotB n=1 Tax=Melghiribacillus thermohalophilus TaxID=1324956 RepID=A0A4R3MUT0_9BACI|nr:flagellar motor protein MotS [Melghiribacillus thermohalophilus]TCT19895.1 chemotaxis protein MotB [Melghiribacillus thermohalophilus]
MSLKKKKKEQNNAPGWMVTYSDLMTLILVFFILLFSMSQIDAEKFTAVAESYRERVIFDFYPSVVPMENPSEKTTDIRDEGTFDDISTPSNDYTEDRGQGNGEGAGEGEQEEDSLNELITEINQFLTDENLHHVITAVRTDRGVVLTLQEKVLFETGQAEIIDEGKPFLNKVSKLLENIPNHVRVEGHTDSRPINTYRYPSNWELSGARASSVIRYLLEAEEKLDPTRFQAVGYGDTRPVAENNSPENWRKNRRVEIVILEPEQVVNP